MSFPIFPPMTIPFPNPNKILKIIKLIKLKSADANNKKYSSFQNLDKCEINIIMFE